MGRGRGRGFGMMGAMADPRSKLFMAMACDQRVKILEALKEGEKSSAQLIEILTLDPSVVSRHTMMLRNAGLVSARKEGVSVYFSLADKRVIKLIDLATDIAKEWYKHLHKYFDN
jgi:ArsR family transcriptional regulator